MPDKLEISIEVIVHATEDIKKILDSFFEVFKIEQDEFKTQYLTGHFENPISLLSVKISKKKARDFLEEFNSKIPRDQIEELLADIENHIQDSTLHLRLGKQELVKGQITIKEKNAIKLKIFTPSYNKKEIIKNYTKLFEVPN